MEQQPVQWTLAECIIGAGAYSNQAVTNGFNQAYYLAVGLNQLQQLKAAGISLFPNPASQFVSILLTESPAVKEVAAYDAAGNLIATLPLQAGLNFFNCSVLPAGSYFLRFTNAQNNLINSANIQKLKN